MEQDPSHQEEQAQSLSLSDIQQKVLQRRQSIEQERLKKEQEEAARASRRPELEAAFGKRSALIKEKQILQNERDQMRASGIEEKIAILGELVGREAKIQEELERIESRFNEVSAALSLLEGLNPEERYESFDYDLDLARKETQTLQEQQHAREEEIKVIDAQKISDETRERYQQVEMRIQDIEGELKLIDALATSENFDPALTEQFIPQAEAEDKRREREAKEQKEYEKEERWVFDKVSASAFIKDKMHGELNTDFSENPRTPRGKYLRHVCETFLREEIQIRGITQLKGRERTQALNRLWNNIRMGFIGEQGIEQITDEEMKKACYTGALLRSLLEGSNANHDLLNNMRLAQGGDINRTLQIHQGTFNIVRGQDDEKRFTALDRQEDFAGTDFIFLQDGPIVSRETDQAGIEEEKRIFNEARQTAKTQEQEWIASGRENLTVKIKTVEAEIENAHAIIERHKNAKEIFFAQQKIADTITGIKNVIITLKEKIEREALALAKIPFYRRKNDIGVKKSEYKERIKTLSEELATKERELHSLASTHSPSRQVDAYQVMYRLEPEANHQERMNKSREIDIRSLKESLKKFEQQ